MQRKLRTLSLVTALIVAMLVFAFGAAESYAADAVFDENTTQLENGYRYIASGHIAVDSRIEVNGIATINLRKGATLDAAMGIHVPVGSELIIEGTGGTLNAYIDSDKAAGMAGIGANSREDGGNITIRNGANVTATGCLCGAGIGGGVENEYTGTVRITGGTVTAKGGKNGAGIGSGGYKGGVPADFKGTIIISGGKVTASSTDESYFHNGSQVNNSGAGIGAGYESDMKGKIEISGGEVTADGGTHSAGIGAGKEGNAADGEIYISGGTVTATGKSGGAGIGGGKEGSFPHWVGGEGAYVNISGGTVIANSDFCAIGHGDNDNYMGRLVIADYMKVQAGNNGTDYERTFTAAEQVDACQYRHCARIEVCDHPDSTYESDEEGHRLPCQYCYATLKKSPHEFVEVEGSAADGTCVHPGKTADQKCSICGYVKEGEETEYGDHNWGEVTYTWSDDNSQVTASRVCRRDPEHTESETVSTSFRTEAATCEETEKTIYTASFTNESFETQEKTVVSGEALGHDWGEWEEISAPTAEAEGAERRVCGNDPSHVEERPIPKLDHNHVLSYVEGVDPSCITSGHTGYYECTNDGCTAIFEDEAGTKQTSAEGIRIPATGHRAGSPVKGAETQADCCYVGGYNLTTKCEICGRVISVQHVIFPIDPDAHDWDDGAVTKAATETETGIRTYTCKLDPSHTKTEIIPVLVSIKDAKVVLSASAFSYNGKVRKPTIKTIGGKTLKAGTDYTVKWSNSSSKNVGSYKVTITGKGSYTGVTKVTYKINPKGTSLGKLQRAKKAVTVAWKAQTAKMSKTRITGYQIQLATDSKFTKNKKTVNVKGYRTVSKKIAKLKGGKKYYVRIRTYKTVSGTKYYSGWSKAKAVTTLK